MKFNLPPLSKSSTPWLLGLLLNVSLINEDHAAKAPPPKPCASKIAQKAANRVLAGDFKIGKTDKAWTMVAGEFIVNAKDPEGKLPPETARIDIKFIEEESIDAYSAVVGCSTFQKDEAEEDLPFDFGIISFDDKGGDPTLSAFVIVNLSKKTATFVPSLVATGGVSMVKILKEKISPISGFSIKSIEIFKNSDTEIVIRSAGKFDVDENFEFVTVRKFILN